MTVINLSASNLSFFQAVSKFRKWSLGTKIDILGLHLRVIRSLGIVGAALSCLPGETHHTTEPEHQVHQQGPTLRDSLAGSKTPQLPIKHSPSFAYACKFGMLERGRNTPFRFGFWSRSVRSDCLSRYVYSTLNREEACWTELGT